MNWQQIIDPFHNLIFSALVALLPIAFIFWALIVKKMKGYQASLLAIGLALFLALVVYRMPASLALLSMANGVLYGLFPICWIVLTAVFLFNITVKSGQFEIIRHFMASITSDRRLQALLIAFSFGAFLEGTAGFGAPVAITAAMLVGLGFNPLYAAGICLIANTAPVAFGSIGIPITVASQVTAIPEMAISQMVGRTLPFLSLFIPAYLVVLICGFRKALEVWPAIFVSGFSFSLLQYLTSNFLGPSLPDVIAGIGSIIILVVFLKVWKPKQVWQFQNEITPTLSTETQYTAAQIFRACSPFIILTLVIIAWGLNPIKQLLNAWGQIQFEMPGLHERIIDKNGVPIPHIFKFNYLSAAGSAILLSAIVSIPLVGLSFKEAVKIFFETVKQLRFPILTISSVLCFAYLANDSGITLTLAEVLAHTGILFPFFAPVLGWLGVFITGSDTSANALFGKMQASTAATIGVDPVVTVAANVSGGVVGKMISPQSIAVAAAAGHLVGKESDLFRFTVRHSFIMLAFICLLVLGQAYVIKSMIPTYQLLNGQTASALTGTARGITYLVVLGVVLAVIGFLILLTNRKGKTKEQSTVSSFVK